MSEPTRLNPRDFEILVAIGPGSRHGYGIMQEVRAAGGASRVLGPGTLYRALRQLTRRGLIVASQKRDADPQGPPRRYYRLTALGQRVVNHEANRLAALVARVLNHPARLGR